MSNYLLECYIKDVEKTIENSNKLLERTIANQETIIKQNKEQILNQQLLIEALKKDKK
jgi:hypothetical protein